MQCVCFRAVGHIKKISVTVEANVLIYNITTYKEEKAISYNAL